MIKSKYVLEASTEFYQKTNIEMILINDINKLTKNLEISK